VKRTSERHFPDRVDSTDALFLDVKHRYAYELVKEFAARGDHVLDVGCGEGYGSAIVGATGAEYRGVDVSVDSVAHARDRYDGPGVGFDAYDGGMLPYGDSAFDLVTSFQVIEHVEDVDGYLRELSRVARPGGRILLTTPNRTTRLADGERPWNRYHLREYDAAGLGEALRRVFAEVEVFGVRGSEEMERVEHARVARARRFARIDRLGLRYRLPESADARVRSLLRGKGCGRPAPDTRFTVADMWRTSEQLELAIDLFAVAQH
jgi:ubiquinone/menaquinone biosynthesis C-methylase UbiE